ncbi:MAG: nitrate/nitrite transporter NrtS [Pseudomonadota bacterium]
MKAWLAIATRADIVRRSSHVCLIVGTVLTLINNGDALLSGALQMQHVWKIPLTYCVPYLVSTYASVQAALDREASLRSDGG